MTDQKRYSLYKKLYSEGFRKIDIARKLGFEGKRPDTALRNWLKTYETVIQEKKFVSPEITSEERRIKLIDDRSHTAIMRFFQEKENIEILKSIVEREKQKSSLMTEVILIDDEIIDGDQVRTTIRVDKKIERIFTEFCKKNKHYTKYHLMSQALSDFMKKYNKH